MPRLSFRSSSPIGDSLFVLEVAKAVGGFAATMGHGLYAIVLVRPGEATSMSNLGPVLIPHIHLWSLR